MNRYAKLLILAGLWSILPWPGSLQAADVLSLPTLLAQAQEKNPELRAARQAWEVKRNQVTPAGTWPNPVFSYLNERFPSGSDQVSPEKIDHWRIEQAIPFPGKLSGDARMKFHEALIAESEYQAKKLEVAKDLKMRFYQLALTDEKTGLAQESIGVLHNALQIAQSRLAANQSSALDVFTAQTELRKMENELFTEQQQRKLIEIELNTLLNQSADTPLGPAQTLPLTDLPLGATEFARVASLNDPLYWSAMHEINHAKSMLTRNRLSMAPDFGFTYELEQPAGGQSGRQIGFSVSFPLWFERPWKEYVASKAHLTEAEASSERMRNLVLRMVATEFTETQTHLELARSDRDRVVPSALSALRTASQQYASGTTDFLRLLEAFRAWIDAHNSYQNEVYHYGEHWSELERWVGVDLAQAQEALGSQSAVSGELNHAH